MLSLSDSATGVAAFAERDVQIVKVSMFRCIPLQTGPNQKMRGKEISHGSRYLGLHYTRSIMG